MNKLKNLEWAMNTVLSKNKSAYILETGTIRNTSQEYKIGDGHSTEYICTRLRDDYRKYKHYNYFLSIDLDISVCKKYLLSKDLDQFVILKRANSLKVLDAMPIFSFDLVYLDSANDANQILEEFILIRHKMKHDGIIIVDDVDMDSTKVLKGHKVVPFAHELGYNVEIKHGQAIITR